MPSFSLLDGAVGAAYTLLDTLGAVLPPAVSIIAFTTAVRLLLMPLSYAQHRGQRASAALMPRIRELQERHRSDPERLRAETMALYRAERAAPLGGCLPALAQLPFLFVMYQLFGSPTIDGGPNPLLDQRVFGVPLGEHWLGAVSGPPLGVPSLVFLGLFAALAVVAWITGQQAATLAAATRSADPAGAGAAGAAAVARLIRLLPYGTVLFAAVAPLAVGLYLLTSTTWTVLERALYRWRGRVPA